MQQQLANMATSSHQNNATLEHMQALTSTLSTLQTQVINQHQPHNVAAVEDKDEALEKVEEQDEEVSVAMALWPTPRLLLDPRQLLTHKPRV